MDNQRLLDRILIPETLVKMVCFHSSCSRPANVSGVEESPLLTKKPTVLGLRYTAPGGSSQRGFRIKYPAGL